MHQKRNDRKLYINLERKSDAEALVALAKLISLRDAYNKIDGFTPDWTNSSDKYVIEYYKNRINTTSYGCYHSVLAFGSRKTAELFLENFKDLIEIAKPVL